MSMCFCFSVLPICSFDKRVYVFVFAVVITKQDPLKIELLKGENKIREFFISVHVTPQAFVPMAN